MAFHGYVSTTSCSCWNIDSMNRCGVYATADLDNGVFVKCTAINKSTANDIQGYEFTVTPAEAEESGLWVVNTPEVGTTLHQQILSDPREFYNEKGRPMSIKYILPKIDCIEVNAEAFASGALPTTQGFVTVGDDGKLVAASSAPDAGTYFSVLGFKDVGVGMDTMRVVVLQCEAN